MSEKKQQTKLAEKTNQSLNTTSRLPIKNINSSFVNTALTTIANGLSNIKPIDFSTILNPYPFDGASQEEIPVKNIYDGIVETYSGKFYGYIEILPINYYKKSYSDQVDVIRSYLDLFTDDFYRFHIKIMSDGAEPTDLINNIKSRNRREKDPKVISVLNDYVQFIYYLACTYVYTAYKITDSDGFVLGRNVDKNTTMIAINNFFTKRYSNANMIILGTSGSGKSFTNMMIGRRMFFNGIRCFFIIPKKGYEYRRCVEAVNGSYIPLYPGSPFCINVLDIRPESVVDASKLSEDVVLKNNVSLLSQKVNFLITWLRLLACEESSEDYKRWFSKKSISRLNSKIIELYNRFGITDDTHTCD